MPDRIGEREILTGENSQEEDKGKNIIDEKIEEHALLNSNPIMEDIIKKHLEYIILYIIYNRPMCGFDLVKEIFLKYNVLLSQGTVYPYLYSLKAKGILQIEFNNGDMRKKIYAPSVTGKQIIEAKMKEFIVAEDYILNSLRKR